jgi:DNA-binding beta-propeller fold protein YncE
MTKSAVLCAFSLPIAFVFVLILFFSGFFMNETEAAIVEGTIAVGHHPVGVAVNANTNKVYVTNYESGFVSVIDGFTNNIENYDTIAASAIKAVNPNTNRVYATPLSTAASVSVIDGSTNRLIDNVMLDNNPSDMAVNANTNRVYVISDGHDKISVVNGLTNKVLVSNIAAAYDNLMSIAVNPNTNRIYARSQ